MKRYRNTVIAVFAFALLGCGLFGVIPGGEKATIRTTIDGEKDTLLRNAEKIYQSQLMQRNRTGIRTTWEWEQWRGGKLIAAWTESNVVTNEGLDALLDIMFHADTQITVWYIALFESDTTPSSATTYAVPVYTESTAYDEVSREEYVEAAASSQVMTNVAARAEFTMNATKTIYGAALVGGGTSPAVSGDVAGGGTLFCASQFTSGSKSVEDDDVLKVTIAITASDA